jgi:hypothetical protein
MGLADRLSHLVTAPQHVGVLACALPPVRQCGGVVQRPPGGGRRQARGRVKRPQTLRIADSQGTRACASMVRQAERRALATTSSHHSVRMESKS